MCERSTRLDDEQAHQRALLLLAALLGDELTDGVAWDPVHRLQGHVDVGDDHVVLIAPRNEHHEPRVLTQTEWNALRRGIIGA